MGSAPLEFALQSTQHIASPWLKQPVDQAAAIPQIVNPRFASRTTLTGGSDLIVVNRGDGALLGLRSASADGSHFARRSTARLC